MRLLLCAALALPILALDNHVTLQDKSGADHGTRQFVIPRYFAKDEICANPKPYIGGSAVTYWQSHVENRWPVSGVCAGGSAKFAVIIIETTLSSGENKAVHFRNSADACHLGDASTCAAAGMTKTDLLDFDAGGGAASWGAKIQATTGGITLSRSARTMISSDHYQIIRNGPIYAEVLVREGPEAVSGATTRDTNFGWKCTANCAGPYTSSTWVDDSSYYSIRPSFWLRFYRRWQKVETDVVLHSGWMDRFVDQRINSYEIFTGGSEDVAALQQANPIILGPRMTVWEGPFWEGGTPLPSHIDFNLRYLIASRVIPPLNTENLPGAAAIALELASFAATDQGVTTTATATPALGWGQYNRVMYVAGTNPYSSLFPRWTGRYLATQDASLFNVVLSNARALMHFPFAYLETGGSEWATGTSAASFGRPVSIEKRPTFMGYYLSPSNAGDTGYVAVGDRVLDPNGNIVLPGCSTCYVAHQSSTGVPWKSQTSATWAQAYVDLAHHASDFFIPYFTTGKPLFREAMQHMAAYAVAGTNSNTRRKQNGLFDAADGFPRAYYWPMRSVGHAAIVSPDGTPEKTYFTRLLENNIEFTEGKLGLTAGNFPPTSTSAPYGCPSTSYASYTNNPAYSSIWCYGKYYAVRGLDNPMGWPALVTATGSPLLGFNHDPRNSSELFSHWMFAYGANVYGHLRDLGFSKISAIQESMSKTWMKMFADSAAGRDLSIIGQYYIPIMNAADTAFLQTPGELRAAVTRSVKVARAFDSSATTFWATGWCSSNYCPGTDYIHISSGPAQVGTEKIVVTDQITPRNYWWKGSISAASDRISFTQGACSGTSCSVDTTGVHTFQDGDLTTITNGGPAVLSGLPISADATNCMSRSLTDYCTYYVKVIDTRTIELYKDAALTTRVDFTSDVTGTSAWAGIVEWTVMTTNVGRCGGISCRGVQGTTAMSHAVGETINLLGVWQRQPYMTNGQFGYAHKYRSAMAFAASYPVTITDSLTGETITSQRAYDLLAALTPYAETAYGSRTACPGPLDDLTECANIMWAWQPWSSVAPTNVRVSGGTGSATLRWVAPDGGFCRYAVASSFDNPDDSGDTSDGGGHRSRAATVSLAAGTYVYRISCGSGRSTGTVTVN